MPIDLNLVGADRVKDPRSAFEANEGVYRDGVNEVDIHRRCAATPKAPDPQPFGQRRT